MSGRAVAGRGGLAGEPGRGWWPQGGAWSSGWGPRGCGHPVAAGTAGLCQTGQGYLSSSGLGAECLLIRLVCAVTHTYWEGLIHPGQGLLLLYT